MWMQFVKRVVAGTPRAVTCSSMSTAQIPNRVNKDGHQIKEVNFDPQNRPLFEISPQLIEKLHRGEKTGRVSSKCFQIPDRVSRSIETIFGNEAEFSKKELPAFLAAGVKLRNFLSHRQLPMEKTLQKHRLATAKEYYTRQYESELVDEATTSDRLDEIRQEIEKKAEVYVKRTTYKWKEVDYDKNAALAYLLAKAPYDYACTSKVLNEIKRREPDFKPYSHFDFGSGVGSAVWAVRELYGDMQEVFCVDTSGDMIDLATKIIEEGKGKEALPAGYFYRMSLPVSNQLTYNLTTSCFSLLELPSAEERLKTIDILWKKTDGYLVIIEEGTNAAFQALSEVRDYLAQVSQLSFQHQEMEKAVQGYLFAPCPHSGPCPRYFNDKIPCNFDIKYMAPNVDGMPKPLKNLLQHDRFSYLIFKKGDPPKSDSSFPRLVHPPVKKKNHIYCRLCTKWGKLQEIVTVKVKSDLAAKTLFKHAKFAHCGDQLMVDIKATTSKIKENE